MKIQELAIIFVIIILPISILLSEYTQFQIQTIKTQTEYDTKLTAATYDAIKAFQLNSQNESYAGIKNQRAKEIENSVKSFRNSIMSTFKLNGYTEDELNNYIPALVYTLYDGFYIYSPYKNINYRYEYKIDTATGEIIKDPYTGEPEYKTDEAGNKIETEGNGDKLYGLKPYINYSCRYKKDDIDVVITYSLDNYVTVQGMLDDKYVNRSGYLIDNITATEDGVWYNGVEIEVEQLQEHVGNEKYKYVKKNGDKYYLIGNKIICISNGEVSEQTSEGSDRYQTWVDSINNNTYAQQYYKDAAEFTKWFRDETNLADLTYNDAYDEVIDENEGETSIKQIWEGNTTKVFDFNTGTNAKDNIENELSNFNQHRLAVIRHKIETNLAIVISNYNEYAAGKDVRNVFQMPQIKEDEWEQITHNISLISFLQGLPIGGKIYNGYTIVTNSESKEVVLEQNIYILGNDKNYHKIGDNNFEVDDSGIYGGKVSTGRLNLDFKRATLTNNEGNEIYYYPLKAYNASYNSIVMQGDVTTYDDIYQYVNAQNDDLKKAFYTALGRERYALKVSIEAEEVLPGGGGESPGEESSGEEETLETYTVTYVGNGGVVDRNFDTKRHGEDLTLAPAPTWLEHRFVEWNTKSDGTGESYEAGGIYSKDENVTLYAIWEEKMCTLELYPNGGTYTTGQEKITATVGYGKTITIPPEQANPTRLGYTFLGYSESQTAMIATYMPGQSITLDRNIKLYAVWKQNTGPLTVTFNLNGGTWAVQQSTTVSVSQGAVINLPPAPSKDGYMFDGWMRAVQNLQEPLKHSPGSSYTVTANTTFTAKWVKMNVNTM